MAATKEVIGLKEPDSYVNAKKKRMKKYEKMKVNNTSNNEYNPICWRFPSLQVCGCTRPCREAVKTVQIFEIIPGLFVGPVHGAYKHQYLYKKNVRCILNVSNEKYNKDEKLFKYLQIKIEDDVNTQIIPYFKETNKFIDDALMNNKGVYVHCRAGISRSPSFIMAYLMYKKQIGYVEADKIVGRVHPDAHPNSSFVRQLEQYQKNNQQSIMFNISKKMNLNKLKKQEQKDDK